MEAVPEKVEPLQPVGTLTELPVANHVVSTSLVEEPASPAAGENKEEISDIPVEDVKVDQTPVEEKLPEEGIDVASPEPEAPAKELQKLEVSTEDEKEVDTAELPANTENLEVTEVPQEEKMAFVEESHSPTEEEEEDRYKHLKVTLTIPEQDNAVPRNENGEKPTDKDQINVDNQKMVPDKDEKESDSDSGSGSAADNSSVDLNLSISSFLSKTKETGSVSIQVTHTVHKLK